MAAQKSQKKEDSKAKKDVVVEKDTVVVMVESQEKEKSSETTNQEAKKPQETTEGATEAQQTIEMPEAKQESSWDKEVDKAEGAEGSKTIMLWAILAVLLLGVLAVGGMIAYQQGVKKGQEMYLAENTTPTPAPTKTPTPTKVTVDKSAHSIKILNGSGIAGEAGRVKALLEDAGFTVDSIGNAATSDNTETTIQAKEDADNAFIKELETLLGKSYNLAETEELSDSESVDIVVIVGSGKAGEE